MKFSEMLCST